MPKSTVKRSKTRTKKNLSIWEIVQQHADNRLSLEQVVAAAIYIADAEGLEAVSMRRIAAELNSSPMALYHHVPSKTDLFKLMLDACSPKLDPSTTPKNDWREALTDFALENRQSHKKHPWAPTLIATGAEFGPQTLARLEWVLEQLFSFGFDTKTASEALWIMYIFVNGFVEMEAAESNRSRPRNAKRFDGRTIFPATLLASGKYPNVSKLVGIDLSGTDDKSFERGLNWILDGIATHLKSDGRGAAERRKKKA